MPGSSLKWVFSKSLKGKGCFKLAYLKVYFEYVRRGGGSYNIGGRQMNWYSNLAAADLSLLPF